MDIILKILWDFSGVNMSQFSFSNKNILISPNNGYGSFNEIIVRFKEIIDVFKKCYWEYDFCDSWFFTIEIKKIVDSDVAYPVIKRFKGGYNLMDHIGCVLGLENLIKNNPDEFTTFNQEFVQSDFKHYKDNYLYKF